MNEWLVSIIYFALLWLMVFLSVRHGRKQGYEEAEIIIHDRVQVEGNLIYINGSHIEADIEKVIVIFNDKACVYRKEGEV